MKLLLVDDEPGIREGLAALLRRKGHEVVTAGDCARATVLLSDGDFDLVLTDWRLPDGLAESFLIGIPCPAVAMSGHPEEIVGYPALCEVLTKPVMPNRLVDLIASFESRPADADEHRLPGDVAALVS